MTEIKHDIPYVAYESALVRADRTNKRLWILTIILAVMLIVTNLAWVIYESSFETISVSQEAEAQGGNATINDGVRINGESETNN